MRTKKNHNKEKQTPPFSVLLNDAPAILQRRFLKHCAVTLLICLFTILMAFYFHSWGYCIGFIIALYIGYLGCDLIYSFHSGKLICKTMVCIKVNRKGKERIDIIARELEIEEPAKNTTHQFYVSGAKKELEMLTLNTVIAAYYRPNSPAELVAWEVLDYLGQT